MSQRTSEANKAVALAWQREQQLVAQGKGTRNWTQAQREDILLHGKAYDENGKAFEGHHMKSVEKYPEYQGNPENIQFLSKEEHLVAHNGNFQNSTNGYYDPSTGQTKEFESAPEPCCITILSEDVENVSSNENLSTEAEGTTASIDNTATVNETQESVSDNVDGGINNGMDGGMDGEMDGEMDGGMDI